MPSPFQRSSHPHSQPVRTKWRRHDRRRGHPGHRDRCRCLHADEHGRRRHPHPYHRGIDHDHPDRRRQDTRAVRRGRHRVEDRSNDGGRPPGRPPPRRPHRLGLSPPTDATTATSDGDPPGNPDDSKGGGARGDRRGTHRVRPQPPQHAVGLDNRPSVRSKDGIPLRVHRLHLSCHQGHVNNDTRTSSRSGRGCVAGLTVYFSPATPPTIPGSAG